ncbi:MAG: hypothetical protein ACRDGM_09860, partial [bacterium]
TALADYSAIRTREISGMAGPYIDVTDRCGRLLARLTRVLGAIPPSGTQDIVLRDLMADVFDCLYEARVLILSGKCTVAYSIARRAYESLSLLHLCALDSVWAERWERGEKISNAQIRKQLSGHPMGEPEEQMRELYNFFCMATHPNRDLVPHRLLGEGNLFVLGAIRLPDLLEVVHYAMKHLEMWFWLAATVTFFYREQLTGADESYHAAYMTARKDAESVMKDLTANYNRLLDEYRATGDTRGRHSV